MAHSSASHYRCWKCNEPIEFSAFGTHRCPDQRAIAPTTQQVNYTLMERMAAIEPLVTGLTRRVDVLEAECDRLRNLVNRGFVMGVTPKDGLLG